MFVVAEFKDTIRVLPQDLSKPKEQAVEDEINVKYSNRVFHKVGLCICVHEVLDMADGIVQHTEGSVYYKVRFSMVVFRPFPGEVIVGKILSSSRDGIRVSTSFFDDILIPPSLLPTPKHFDENDKVWYWEWEGAQLYLDVDEPVRVQVQSVDFVEVRPGAAKRAADGSVMVSATDHVPSPFTLLY
ncbi:DNA-directed RNA polymerase III complex subunit Rpc25 [Blastocladiella emersonii ATCC 22665]|nr:DNA-directed RNA polymerase III complex subunit Rpc25 [Blastocladiella emersonii ATCC 22665]